MLTRLVTRRDVLLKGSWHGPERRPRAQGKVLLPFLGVGERPEAVGWAPNDAKTAFLVGGEENVTEPAALMPARPSPSPLLQAE